VTAIEVMPIAEFPGARGWGYDGVYLSAAQSSYGGPEAFQRLVEAAHATGLAVILDVVYNHVGASGVGALRAFGPYFTSTYETPWGRAINYDGADSDPVREWVLQSAERWVGEFGVDGLRLDAIHAIFDSSAEHIVAAIARRVHAARPGALVFAESALNDPVVIRCRQRGGYGCDAAWADDFHHALRTLLTDEREGYYADFGRIEDLAKAWTRPFVYDGGYSEVRRRRIGAPAGDVPPERFIVCSQNHDQVGNRAFGDRMPAQARPLAAFCTLLAPFTPMLFMGEEYGEHAPFQFFSDHIDRRIAEATRAGRRAEFAAFASFGREIPDPQSIETFEASKLTRTGDPAIASLYTELLALRCGLLAPADGDLVAFAAGRRWLRISRSAHELICNFDQVPVTLAVHERRLVFTTADETELRAARIRLAPLSGAVLAPALTFEGSV
jgi:maltooligosyltrehalose trehalohydrolase